MINRSWGIRTLLFGLILCSMLLFSRYFIWKPLFFVPQSQQKLWSIGRVGILMMICLMIIPLDIKIVRQEYIMPVSQQPLVILFDVSLSMAATDIVPSRFLFAQSVVQQLIKHLDQYDIALIAYSWIPLQIFPFSQDHHAMIKNVQSLSLAQFPLTFEFAGTAIGNALLMGTDQIRKFWTGTNQSWWIILLITDGDNNKWYHPDQILPFLAQQQIKVFSVGIAEENFDIGRDFMWTPVMTTIDRDLLSRIAQMTKGGFFRVGAQTSLDGLVNRLTQEITPYQKWESRFRYFSFNSLIFMLLWVLLVVYATIFVVSFVSKKNRPQHE